MAIETFFRKLGSHAIEAHEFMLADTNDMERITEIKNFIGCVRHALQLGRVAASSPIVLSRIISAAKRVDETLYTRNVEGIVFTWRGEMRKLTGAFTAINRLHGYFAFENAARIV